ncbi:CHAT domain-containing protein [Aetokthonos hydrillicola]|nr:CHAT domain-containing protein [Aetokthonos hydrillicola]
MLSANPKNTNPLRLGEEARKIQEALKLAKHRDEFEIATSWAVRVEDLRRAMIDYQPNIIHFSGHGVGAEGLAFEDNSGMTQLVSSEAIASLFELFRGTVECVLLNACYSEVQAQAIHQHVDHVIGMNQSIGDVAGIEFTIGFYDALGAGESYDYAFRMGCNAIQLKASQENSTPVIKSRPSSVSVKKAVKSDVMSEKKSQQKSSEGIVFNISGAKIGGGIQAVQGDNNLQSMTNYAAIEQKLNLAEVAKEIQQLLQKIENSNPATTRLEKLMIVTKAVEHIENNSALKARVLELINADRKEALKKEINHPLAKIVLESIEDL